MGNWQRTGFADHDPQQDPGAWISTVVNNRADRVARSKVFASILVEDLSADRHFLIGNNLNGLMGFVAEAWEGRQGEYSPWADKHSPTQSWLRRSRAMRQATCADDVVRGVTAMLRGIAKDKTHGIDWQELSRHAMSTEALGKALIDAGLPADEAPDVVNHQAWLLRSLHEYTQIASLIESSDEADCDRVAMACRRLLRTWFERKFVVIEDYHASGDDVIERIAAETPPGFLNRIMGLQNIKGTGLGFVYQWQAWLELQQTCRAIRANDSTAATAVEQLQDCREFGLLTRAEVRDTLGALRQEAGLRGLAARVDLGLIESRLEESESRARDAAAAGETGGQAGGGFWSWVEDWLDAADGVRRRRLADRIYRDLQQEQISLDDVVNELRRLNARQKGGWLKKSVESIWPRKKIARGESDDAYVQRLEAQTTSESDVAQSPHQREPASVA
jgi:hypothetical protein